MRDYLLPPAPDKTRGAARAPPCPSRLTSNPSPKCPRTQRGLTTPAAAARGAPGACP